MDDREARARIRWSHNRSAHFLLSFDLDYFSPEAAEALLTSLEDSYSSIFSYTHEAFATSQQVYAVDVRNPMLLGHSFDSHYNFIEGAIYLIRTPNQPLHSMLVPFVSHAMRQSRVQRHYGKTPGWALMEDAFGTFLNCRLSDRSDVYPFFDADPSVIASVILGENPTYSVSNSLRNFVFAPAFERNVLTGAFFLFLGDMYGDDKIVQFSKCESPIDDEIFTSFFGATLMALEALWRRSLPTSLLSYTHEEQLEMFAAWQRQLGE